jgi:hypothetical protein
MSRNKSRPLSPENEEGAGCALLCRITIEPGDTVTDVGADKGESTASEEAPATQAWPLRQPK